MKEESRNCEPVGDGCCSLDCYAYLEWRTGSTIPRIRSECRIYNLSLSLTAE